jgi:flagellar biosynthesis chaperone FliJ
MADLNPLIRLNKFRLEEKQRFLSGLYAEVETLEIQKRAILDDVESERGVVDEALIQDVSMMQAFMAYVQRTKKEVEAINGKISSLEIKINRAVDEMREAFGELKKVEITRDRRLDAIKKANQKKEDELFSEIALEIYRRKQADD